MKKQKKARMGRPLIGNRPLTAAERMKRHRAKLAQNGARHFLLSVSGSRLASIEELAQRLGTSVTETIDRLLTHAMVHVPAPNGEDEGRKALADALANLDTDLDALNEQLDKTLDNDLDALNAQLDETLKDNLAVLDEHLTKSHRN